MTHSNVMATLVVLLGSVAALAQGPGAQAGSAPVVQEQLAEGIYTVEGSFDVDSDAATAWAVLKDYDHLGSFVSSIDASVVLRRRLGRVLLQQDGTGRTLLFVEHFHVLLDIREGEEGGIAFRDLSHRDFDLYEGSWNVGPALHGSQVVYRLRAKPRQRVPGFIGKSAFDAGASRLLTDVQTEILRRTRSSLDHVAALPQQNGGNDVH